ncbi:hypothetical protein HPP92_010259 [Vanilla planifolia]|uniref:Uncharacterized protein n=1 Tax=Vanilla planifolia TaxID=51239 RepID=A0A835R639_VANPL|nr:hypothetical protein HPP92_010259 [Vanilla planifolia]
MGSIGDCSGRKPCSFFPPLSFLPRRSHIPASNRWCRDNESVQLPRLYGTSSEPPVEALVWCSRSSTHLPHRHCERSGARPSEYQFTKWNGPCGNTTIGVPAVHLPSAHPFLELFIMPLKSSASPQLGSAWLHSNTDLAHSSSGLDQTAEINVLYRRRLLDTAYRSAVEDFQLIDKYVFIPPSSIASFTGSREPNGKTLLNGRFISATRAGRISPTPH